MSGLPDIRGLLQLTEREALPDIQAQRVVLQAAQLAIVSTTCQAMRHVRAQVLNEAYPALGKHARNISEELITVHEALQHAIDDQTAEVRDCSSEKLAKIREARALNKKELQHQIDEYCRLLYQQGASDLKAPVMRRDRLCCSVKRGRSGVRVTFQNP